MWLLYGFRACPASAHVTQRSPSSCWSQAGTGVIQAASARRSIRRYNPLMKVFICWSGERSKAVAEALASWLRQVVHGIEPWLSTRIPKGARWELEIGAQLEDTSV